MSEQPHRTGPGFERRDIASWPVTRWGLAIVLVTVTAVLAMLLVFRALKGGPPERVVASPLQPPEPRLQVDEPADLAHVESVWRERLASYGWVDREAGVVHMPIEEAMRLVVQRGLPVRSPVAPPSPGRTDGAGGTP